MGYIKQGDSCIFWGVTGKLGEQKVIQTKSGETQLRKISVCVQNSGDNNKDWVNIECWGPLATREDIRAKTSLLVFGHCVTNTYVSKTTGKQETSSVIRADFIFTHREKSFYEKYAQPKVPDEKITEIPTELLEIPEDDMPF